MKLFKNSKLPVLALGLFVSLAPMKSFAAKDPAACGQVAQTLELQKDRFEEMEAGVNSADEICGEDSDPKACVAAIKAEFNSMKGEIKTAQAKKATACTN